MNGAASLYFLIPLMVVIWSGNYAAGKFALREFPPLLLAGLRVTMAAVVIAPLYLRERLRAKETWARADLPLLLSLGMFGVALNQVFFVMGLDRTTVAHSAIVIGTTPILVLAIAAARGMERITARKLAGMAIAFAGLVILNVFETRPRGRAGATIIGDLLTFGAALAFSLFTVFGKPATRRHSPLTVTTFGFVGGAVALSPMTIWQAAGFSFQNVTAVGWLGLAYMAIGSSVAAYLIYYYALAHMAPSRVSAFSYLQAPLATVFGVFLLREHVTLPLVASAAVIFTGVYLTEGGR